MPFFIWDFFVSVDLDCDNISDKDQGNNQQNAHHVLQYHELLSDVVEDMTNEGIVGDEVLNRFLHVLVFVSKQNAGMPIEMAQTLRESFAESSYSGARLRLASLGHD